MRKRQMLEAGRNGRTRRARRGLLLLSWLLLAGASPARAFHAGAVFGDPPGAGGGGGLFYVGSPRERGWDCTACHVEAPGELEVRFFGELFRDFEYEPGGRYELTARMERELLGQGSPRSNFNSVALVVLDGEAREAGALSGFAADAFYLRGDAQVASAGMQPGETEWQWTWTAPAEARGEITFHIAVVDGNGADSPPTETLTDPFGDDVWVRAVTVHPKGSSEQASLGARERPTDLTPLLACTLLLRRRRRRGRRER